MLFNLFVNDIFYLFDNAKCDLVKLQTKLIHCLMYADDLLILSETENGLTKRLEKLSNYAKRWKLKISAKKTIILCTTGTQKISCDLRYSLYPYESIIILCTTSTQKISCDLRYNLCPYKLSIIILCTTGTQKISCDLRYSLCPYESITIFVYQWYTKNLMRLYTCSSCRNRFLSTSVLFHSATCS